MTAESMIPCTPEVLQHMMYRVTEVLLEYGVLVPPPDESEKEAERFTQSAMQVFNAQGLINSGGDIAVGRCLLLPIEVRAFHYFSSRRVQWMNTMTTCNASLLPSALNGPVRDRLSCPVGGC